MDTREKEEEVAARPDLSQYENWCGNLESWKQAEAAETDALAKLPAREKAAKEMLAFADAPPSDHQKAEEVLVQCSRRRSKLETSLVGTRRLIESYEQRIAALRPEYERRRDRETLAARLRGKM